MIPSNTQLSRPQFGVASDPILQPIGDASPVGILPRVANPLNICYTVNNRPEISLRSTALNQPYEYIDLHVPNESDHYMPYNHAVVINFEHYQAFNRSQNGLITTLNQVIHIEDPRHQNSTLNTSTLHQTLESSDTTSRENTDYENINESEGNITPLAHPPYPSDIIYGRGNHYLTPLVTSPIIQSEANDIIQEYRDQSMHQFNNVSILQYLPEEIFQASSHCVSTSFNECAICHMAFEKHQKLKRLPCFHIFHSDCIARWLRERITCPLCRLDIIEIMQSDIFNSHIPFSYTFEALNYTIPYHALLGQRGISIIFHGIVEQNRILVN